MEPDKRGRLWRTVVIVLCGLSLAVSAAAFYGIKRLQAKSKPHVHLIREVNKITIDPQKAPQKK